MYCPHESLVRRGKTGRVGDKVETSGTFHSFAVHPIGQDDGANFGAVLPHNEFHATGCRLTFETLQLELTAAGDLLQSDFNDIAGPTSEVVASLKVDIINIRTSLDGIWRLLRLGGVRIRDDERECLSLIA